MGQTFQIKEYGSFVCNKKIMGYVSLPENTFFALEEFILANHGDENEPIDIMGISARKGIGKIITAKNYIGTIRMNDGTIIEILPKIYSEIEDDEQGTRTKKLVLNMLRTLRNSPFKSFQTSTVNVEKMNVFEIFVRMFIDEVFYVVKRGLKCSYEPVEENANFYKGKMLYSKQLKYNLIHKEKNYIVYDVFNVNRPENRLIKATLQHLYKYTGSIKSKNDIKNLLTAFNEVPASIDYKADFAKYVPERNMKDYDMALLWSRIFLMGKSFTSFSGSEVAVALLFPMEMLFEGYIASILKRELGNKGYTVSIQEKKYHLFDEPGKRFLMRPDIVITRKSDFSVFVMDTKWKVLSENKHNYGISQADMYQMYAYHKKYNAVNVTLIYPRTDGMSDNDNIEFISEDGAIVKIFFVDLFRTDNIVLTLGL